MYWLIKAVHRSFFVAILGIAKNPTFLWTCSIRKCRLMNYPASIKLFDSDPSQLAFAVQINGVHAVIINNSPIWFRPAFVPKLIINVSHTSLAPPVIYTMWRRIWSSWCDSGLVFSFRSPSANFVSMKATYRVFTSTVSPWSFFSRLLYSCGFTWLSGLWLPDLRKRI